ncbi:FMN-dependent NADH-azoreductase [Streptomyces werraensis]|uniref:FMN-dependent NADH-azoreductase n=1 Tax=Streptomyces werraensis TaxID=68284 RepID=UPI0037D7FE34
MSHLLHVDSSFGTESVSRRLTAYFAEEWRNQHPGGGYSHRDVAAQPIPHITEPVHKALIYPGTDNGQSAQERDLTEAITREVVEASTIVLGVPMHNYTVPSTLKAWLDRIVHPAHMAVPRPLGGKKVVAVLSRGGSYAPGTPREACDYQQTYLKAILGAIGLGEDLTFVTAELTMATVAPQMARFKPLAEASMANAYETLEKLAQ